MFVGVVQFSSLDLKMPVFTSQNTKISMNSKKYHNLRFVLLLNVFSFPLNLLQKDSLNFVYFLQKNKYFSMGVASLFPEILNIYEVIFLCLSILAIFFIYTVQSFILIDPWSIIRDYLSIIHHLIQLLPLVLE